MATTANNGVPRIVLLGGFGLENAGPEDMPALNSRRVLAFLAVHNRPLHRQYVAGSLWTDARDKQAGASLRSALWRLKKEVSGLVLEATNDHLRIAPGVRVDLHETVTLARRVVDSHAPIDLRDIARNAFASDLLPDWYDEWLLADRERVRQLRLHALERLSERFVQAGAFSEAIEAAQLAVAAEPLRESAHRALAKAHAAEGNVSEAVRQYNHYKELLSEELGLAPSHRMEDLMLEVYSRSARTA